MLRECVCVSVRVCVLIIGVLATCGIGWVTVASAYTSDMDEAVAQPGKRGGGCGGGGRGGEEGSLVERLLEQSSDMWRIVANHQQADVSVYEQVRALDQMTKNLLTTHLDLPPSASQLVDDGKYDLEELYGLLKSRSRTDTVKMKAMRLLALMIGTELWEKMDSGVFDDKVVPIVVLHLWSGSDELKAQAAHAVRRFAIAARDRLVCRNVTAGHAFADFGVAKALVAIVRDNRSPGTRALAASALLNLMRMGGHDFARRIHDVPGAVQALVRAHARPWSDSELELQGILMDLMHEWDTHGMRYRDAIRAAEAELERARAQAPAERPSFCLGVGSRGHALRLSKRRQASTQHCAP